MRRFLLLTALTAPGVASGQSVDAPDAIVCQLLDGDCESLDSVPDEAPRTRGGARTSSTRSFSFGAARPKEKGKVAPPPSQKNVAAGQYDLRVQFMLNSAEVDPASRAQIEFFAVALKDPRLAGRRIRIEGHTDSTGGADANLGLSDRRARAVSDMIAGAGVDAARLDVRGFGATRPLPGLPASAAENRRVIGVLVK